MPSISVLYDHNIEGTEELQDKILEFVDEVIVGEFGAELLASEKNKKGDVIFDFKVEGYIVNGKVITYSNYMDITLRVPLIVVIYKNKIIKLLDEHIPNYFGEQR
tara:strand:- start:90 stop:404 length:315 start_codon:yes stop_codon:yes gene_type:complete